MTVSPPPASGKFLRIERDGSPGRCGARRSGRGSFERVVRVRSVGGDGDGARKSLGTACAPDSAQRVDVASVQKPHILFLPGKWPRISTLTSLTRIRNLAFSLTVNNRWADARTVRDWTAIRDCSSPGETIGQKRKIRADLPGVLKWRPLPPSDVPTQHTHSQPR